MKIPMDEFEKRKILSEVALGNRSADTVVLNGTAFNAFTGEFIPGQSIWIEDGRIAYVGPDHDAPRTDITQVIDADGMVLLPGLFDGHTHMACAKSGIDEFIKYVIPGGTTTVVTEVDPAGIFGADGERHWVKAFEGQPIRILYTAPALCGLIPAVEAGALEAQQILPYLEDPNCLGVGELYWSNLLIEGRQGERLRGLASVALKFGKHAEGHTAGASGRKLAAYSCLGVSSCHEPITEDEVMERLRLGFWTMIREGSIRRELPRVKGVFKRGIDFRRLILSTDGVDPVDLLEKGYLDDSLRTLLGLGVSPHLAYQMVTINVAEHFRLDHSIGSLSPGRMADLVIIPSPEKYSPQLVMCNGKVIYRDGKVMVEARKVRFPDFMFDTIHIKGTAFPTIPRHGRVRVIDLVTNLVTKEGIIDLDNPEESKDVIMAMALDRFGSGEVFMGFLKGFGLERGALGSTLCWDTSDMVVLGRDTQSMATVMGRLEETSGGVVYANGQDVVAEYPAPLGGYLSLDPMEVLRDRTKRIEEALRTNGVKWEKPTLTIDTLTTAAIPHIRITHNGYVRLRDRKVLPWQV